MTIRPTPSQERWLAIGRRFDLNADREPLPKHVGGWRTASLWSRCVLFVLGLVAAAMSVIIGEHLWSGAELLVAGSGCIAVAEWLILKRRYFYSGIEESLAVSGLVMLAYECSVRSGASAHTVAFVLALALAAAGFRLLSPGCTALSALALIVTLDAPPLGAGLSCYFIGLCALMGGRYSFRRPSNDFMLDYLVIVMPVAGYLWSASRTGLLAGTDYLRAGLAQWMVPASALMFAAIAIVIGLRRRTHAPVIAAMLCLACAAYELRRLTGLSLETRLICCGCALLLIAVLLERYLRVTRHGITSRPILDSDGKTAILSMLGSSILTPQSAQLKPTPSFHGAGGQFGGGGASGKY